MADLVSNFDEVESVNATDGEPVEIVLTGLSESPQIAVIVEGPQGPPGGRGNDSVVPGPPGPPGPASAARFIEYTVAIASDEWHISHDFNNPRPDVRIFDNNGDEVYADVSYLSPSEVVIKFAYEMTGMVQLG
jgi:hypothetical protein